MLFIGLDVHNDFIAVSLAPSDSPEVQRYRIIGGGHDDVLRLIKKLSTAHPGAALKFCYEAGLRGYPLCRFIRSHGAECIIASPSKVPRQPVDRVRTNRRDADQLARLLRAGELTGIYVPNPQLGLLDSLMPSPVGNDFLERLSAALDWRPVEAALQAMYPATTGRPPHPPLVLFKLSLLQHCYGLSDPQCEEQVGDRLSWRRVVGLGQQDAVPDETTRVNFRNRLRQCGLHEALLGLVNRQLEQQGLILKPCTLVDATLLQASRRAPARDDQHGGGRRRRPHREARAAALWLQGARGGG